MNFQQTESQSASQKVTVESSTGLKESSVVGAAKSALDGSHHAAQVQEQVTQASAAELSAGAKQLANTVAAAASKISSESISQVAGVIWDDFKKMSPWEKFFAVLAATVVVGAAGYCSWKLLGGNWNTIKQTASCLGGALKEKGLQMIKDFDGNALLQKMAGTFEKRDLAGKIDPKDVSRIWEISTSMGYGGVIAAILNHVKANPC
ncbi:uncharacterized protein LOC110860450 isoform X2 [Folsomia candida]|uniref:Uncharacterized protein n=1 Tax=Folsomia candida TaxID=158441 RepID=A0A226D8R6_FOLCA|nr:uncharacterized protein LOC110860450 isoform X2 [Folsomia candida]OXA40646.1 hypothetical protein Fcan01_24435 [Folsomia candida]